MPMSAGFFFAISLAVLVALSGAVSAISFSLTVYTDSSSYVASSSISIAGEVSPAPGANTSVLLRIYNPNMTLVAGFIASVNGTTGSYSSTFVAGGSSSWTEGTYTVNATWGAFGPVVFKTTTFSWALSATSTTSTSSASTTSSTSSTTSTTSSSTTNSTSTSSTTTSSSLTTSSTSSTTVTSTPSITTSGNVPEFPFQAVTVVLFTALIIGSYLVLRSRSGHASHGLPR